MNIKPVAITMDHRVDFYVPSQCICGNKLPESVRDPVLAEVQSKFDSWFGGHAEIPIKGDWRMPDGTLAKEEVADIYSFCTAEALEQHHEDVDELAVQIANQLTQDRVLRVIDNIKVALWPNTLAGLIPNKNCACHGGAKVSGKAVAQALGAEAASPLSRMLIIQGILRGFDSVEYARELFCNVLNYHFATGELPCRTWPENLSSLLASPPMILADHNGFKIIYLRLAKESHRRSAQRQVIQRIYKDNPAFRGLFIISDKPQTKWDLVNVKLDGKDSNRIVLRKMPVGVDGARTATEQLSSLGVAGTDTAADIQLRHDKAFDVEALSKAFFGEVANWYFWALKHVEFPKDAPKEADGHDHVGVIRLITRLVFCWFLKEKGLISSDLFDEEKLATLLVGFAPENQKAKDSIFYKAILQNLFFATLDMEMSKRGWRRDGQNFMAHSLYRHRKSFASPETALALFKDIPFLNGGLFECLDKSTGDSSDPTYERIDGFSDRADSQPIVPDYLFFGAERELDLSEDYGDTRFKKVKVRGLIHILKHYRFTVEESTPLEEVVALDPELAGQIFENLLAAYNPETGATARKQTGSFYTPREIVDYMVDESLIAYLLDKLSEGFPKTTDFEPRLRHLFSYEEEGHQFNAIELELIIRSIDGAKILDPAVGSGAFPMGVLHKLVFILSRLDPGNEKWKAAQIAKLDDSVMREQAEAVFRDNDVDYGRKLYLIENCLYGVDIQPIAVQISKMRFFISLIADQKVDKGAENLGIRPLPNLETKLVAGNTLIKVDRPVQGMLRNPDIERAEAELRKVRERHFLARTPATKGKCREEDQKLRNQIAKLLRDDGWDSPTAKLLASWDPYNQNTSSLFFDTEWMFGLREGFDIVIGNPPYIRIQTLKQSDPNIVKYYKDHFKSASKGNYDIYVVFIEQGLHLLKPHGHLAYICPHKFFNQIYGEPLRKLISQGKNLSHVVHFQDEQVFQGVTIYTCLLFLARSGSDVCRFVRAANLADWKNSRAGETELFQSTKITESAWNFAIGKEGSILDRLRSYGRTLGDCADIFVGVQTSADKIYALEKISDLNNGIIRVMTRDGETLDLEGAILKPLLMDQGFPPFSEVISNRLLLFPYSISDGAAVLFPSNVMAQKFPKAWKYLQSHSEKLKGRDGGKWNHDKWYGFGRAQSLTEMKEAKIIVQVMAMSPLFWSDTKGSFFTGGGNGPYYGIRWNGKGKKITLELLLSILNSRISEFFIRSISTTFRGGYWSFGKQFIEQIPIPITSESQQNTVSKMVQLLASTIDCLKSDQDNKSDQNTLIISLFERLLNGLMFELYFPREVHEANIALFDLVGQAITANFTLDPTKSCLPQLRKLTEQLQKSSHPIQIALEKLDAIDVVRTIKLNN